jgi:Protein of unknown function (DUF3575)
MNIGLIRRGVGVVALGALALTVSTSSAYAQEGTKIPVGHHQTISANPFGLMVEWFNAEYERKLTNTTTLGVSGSTTAWGDVDLTNGNVFVRYYPQGAALTGFFVGGRTGVARAAVGDANATGVVGGFELGYSWLFGAKRHVGLSIGAGVDRLFFGDELDIDLIRPNIRLVNLGIAF